MPRITSKQSRRLGLNLSGRAKDGYVKRPFAPGKLDSERKHKSSTSEFGQQLRAKQIVRISYGMKERQFYTYVKEAIANKETGITTQEYLYRKLESRLDNIVYRMGLATSRALARQMVVHGHILVNGRRLSVPAHMVRVGDVVSIREGSKKSALFTHAHDKLKGYKSPNWLSIDADKVEATIKSLNKDIEPAYDLQAVIEFYSR
jgi:small subunit ribosomal protein S4